MIEGILKAFRTAWAKREWRAALMVAAASDALGYGLVLAPPLQWMLDAVTALALWALLGFRWPMLPALVIEVIPVVQLFPAWTLAVAAYAAADGAGTPGAPAAPPPAGGA